MLKRFNQVRSVVVHMIVGAAAAQAVKERMEDEARFAERPGGRRVASPDRGGSVLAAEGGRSVPATGRRGVRAGAAAALRAVADRLEPAPSGARTS
jgi:hypothetical protein